MTENEISKVIVDSAIEVHREMGSSGLIESVYEEAMVEEPAGRPDPGTWSGFLFYSPAAVN